MGDDDRGRGHSPALAQADSQRRGLVGGGLFGQDNVTTRFAIGDEVIAVANDSTKSMTVRRNGEVVNTMPISMGENSTPTDNGTYIIGDRHSHLIMDFSTCGVPVNSPDGYRLEVD